MKRYTLTFSILCAFCAWSYAGPEAVPSGKEMMEPAPVAPPPCFDGFYIGIQGAGLFEPSGKTESFARGRTATPGGFAPGLDNTDIDSSSDAWGGSGGIHAGFNHQSGMWVFGLETDLSFSELEQNSRTAFAHQGSGGDDDEDEDLNADPGGPAHLGVQAKAKTDIEGWGTLRARGGIVLGRRFLIFGTGGVVGAWTDSKIDERVTWQFPTEEPMRARIKKSRYKDIDGGWTAGGGLDFCLTEHFLLNFTYLYCDLGDREPTEPHFFTQVGGPLVGPPPFHPGFRIRTRANVLGEIQFHVFQAGLSYKF